MGLGCIGKGTNGEDFDGVNEETEDDVDDDIEEEDGENGKATDATFVVGVVETLIGGWVLVTLVPMLFLFRLREVLVAVVVGLTLMAVMAVVVVVVVVVVVF